MSGLVSWVIESVWGVLYKWGAKHRAKGPPPTPSDAELDAREVRTQVQRDIDAINAKYGSELERNSQRMREIRDSNSPPNELERRKRDGV